MSLAIAYCHYGSVLHKFHESMTRVLVEDRLGRKEIEAVAASQNPYIYDGRNKAVENVLATNADWMLFVDNDIGFTTEQVYALLDRGDDEHQIVAGLYFTWMGEKGGKLVPCWFQKNEDGDLFDAVSGHIEAGQLELGACGMGFTLIGRKLLLAMLEAHAPDPAHWFGHDIYVTKAGQVTRLGEDLTFCVRAKRLGYKIWGYPTVVSHTKSQTWDMDGVLRWNTGKIYLEDVPCGS